MYKRAVHRRRMHCTQVHARRLARVRAHKRAEAVIIRTRLAAAHTGTVLLCTQGHTMRRTQAGDDQAARRAHTMRQERAVQAADQGAAVCMMAHRSTGHTPKGGRADRAVRQGCTPPDQIRRAFARLLVSHIRAAHRDLAGKLSHTPLGSSPFHV